MVISRVETRLAAKKCKTSPSSSIPESLTTKRAAEIQQAYAQCPDTKLVASGYSQGGQIVHNAAALLPAEVGSWISSIVIFGDPDDGQAIPNVAASKVDTYCNSGDNICVNGDLILPAHLTYGLDATAAAAFVAAH